MVIFGKRDVPSKRSAAFIMRRPRKIVKEAACATNFKKGPRMIFPNYNKKHCTKQIKNNLK